MNVNWDQELQGAALKTKGTPDTASTKVVVTSSKSNDVAETVTIGSSPKPESAKAPEANFKAPLWLGAVACAAIGLFLFTRRN